MSRHRGARGLAPVVGGLVVLLALLPGCGRKGPPVIPQRPTPAAVQQLQAQIAAGGVILSWVRPASNADGSRLTDLREFLLSRAVQTPEDRAAGKPPVFTLLATVPADQPANATVLGDRYAFRDPEDPTAVPPGSTVSYRVESVNSRGRTGPAAVTSIESLPAPGPPADLRARPGDGMVELAWQAPTGLPAPQGYNVYRGGESGVHGPAPLNPTPVVKPLFLDGTVANGVTYYYVVRSVAGDGPPFRESQNSTEVVATPEDRTAPAPPSGLAAVPSATGVSLVWDAGTEADLLGYLVYRREPETATPVPLTSSPISTTTFTDRIVRPGASYLYSVSAVDRSPRRNESAPSAEVEVRLP